MDKHRKIIKNVLITITVLLGAFGTSILLQDVFRVNEHVSTVFVFAVFLVSFITDGYVYGIISTFAGVLAVNWAFSFPNFVLDFTVTEDLLSAIIMLIVALLTSMLTTKVKRAEEIKTAGEKERTRANLLRAVSHDLRTPLTTVYGASSALYENYDDIPDERKKEILRGITEDARWLMGLTENLLSVTKIDDGNFNLLKSATVLDELVDSALVQFKKYYPETKVTVDIPDEITVIQTEAVLIKQVLINLLENAALHATGMTQVSLQVRVKNGKATFTVRDDGCGIPKDKLPALFYGDGEPRLNANDGKKRNAGIGLSVCATIIKAHGDEITAENAKGGGAIFKFTLDTEKTQDEQ